jgi:hypothetical protein
MYGPRRLSALSRLKVTPTKASHRTPQAISCLKETAEPVSVLAGVGQLSTQGHSPLSKKGILNVENKALHGNGHSDSACARLMSPSHFVDFFDNLFVVGMKT